VVIFAVGEVGEGGRANVAGCKAVGRDKRARRPCSSNVAADNGHDTQIFSDI